MKGKGTGSRSRGYPDVVEAQRPASDRRAESRRTGRYRGVESPLDLPFPPMQLEPIGERNNAEIGENSTDALLREYMLRNPFVKRRLRSILEALKESGAEPLSPDEVELLHFFGYTSEGMNIAAAIRPAADILGLSVAELQEAAHQYKAAKAEATERDTTGRATGEPRPDDAATVRALAGLEHLQKQFAAASGLPEAERARIGRQLVRTFERLQGRGVEMEPPPEVKAARRFLTPYNQRQKAAKVAALS